MKQEEAPQPTVVTLDHAINPLLFGNGVVSYNTTHGLLFGAVLPEDFFVQYECQELITNREETHFIKYLSRDLQILLKMPFNHFLSHLLCDNHLKETIQTFFLFAPRVYDKKRGYFGFPSHPVPTSPSIPIYALLLRVYYRLVTDEEGQAEFVKAIPPFGGLGDDYWEIVFKNHLLSMEAMADWCTLLGVKNRGIVDLMLEKMEEKHPVFHDDVIGFFMHASKKLEEMAKLLMDEEEAKPRESEYIAFVEDIVWNFTLLLQCVPRLVYQMVDSVQSLLFHSDLKHILIGIFAACRNHPDTQQRMFSGC